MNTVVKTRGWILLALMALAVFLGAGQAVGGKAGTGGAAAEGRSEARAAAQGRTIVVVGTLTDEGAECQALRDDQDALYTLTGNLQGFTNGDRVRVIGQVAELSFCQQGTTIKVRRITRAG